MKTFTFDVKMFATINVPADDEETARRMVQSLDGNFTNFGCWDNGDPITATIGLDGEHDLVEVYDDEEG